MAGPVGSTGAGPDPDCNRPAPELSRPGGGKSRVTRPPGPARVGPSDDVPGPADGRPGGGRLAPEVAWLSEALRDNRRATILGSIALRRPPVRQEDIPLPGGEWSVRLATGRLERADGRPLDGAEGPFPEPGSDEAARTSEGPPKPGPLPEAIQILAKALGKAR